MIEDLKRMEEQGLITFIYESSGKKGRPRKMAQATELGKEYLRDFHQMRAKTLSARRIDFESVFKDLELKHRLVSQGKHPHELFMELRDALIDIRSAK